MSDLRDLPGIGMAVAMFIGLALANGAVAQNDPVKYMVVINHEEQYSIWPVDAKLETGWKTVGDPCVKDQCRNYIRGVWTDMRPRNIDRAIDTGLARAKKLGHRVD